MTALSTEAGLDTALAETIEQRSGLRLGGTRLAASQTAIQRAMTSVGTPRPNDYRLLLERSHSAFDALVSRLTVGETFFFRERAQLELLRHVIIPDVLARCGEAQTVRAWSAGCSTGEEAYSIAIVLSQAGVEGRVLGTDLCRSRLAKAKAGVYGAWSLRGVAPGELDAFLEPAGRGFRVSPSLATRVAFAPVNLISGPPGRSTFDVVFCRNVLIYLTPRAVRQAVDTLIQSLHVGGWLVTASSDPHLAECDDLERVRTPHGIAYRRRDRRDVDSRPVPRDEHRREVSKPPAARTRPDHGAPPSPPTAPIVYRPSEASLVSATELTTAPTPEVDATDEYAFLIRELADRGETADALALSTTAVRAHPTAAELHYLRALLHLGSGRLGEALAAADSALYLQPDLALAHVLRAEATRRLGDVTSSERSLRNARRLLATLPPDSPVPLGDGEQIDALLAAVDAQLVRVTQP